MNLRAVVGTILTIVSSPFLAADQAPSQEVTLPVSDVRPGMRGKVYTVLQGSDVVALDAEIYGVLHGFIGPKKDLIVGKLVDERTRFCGAVHGMSGSPLYIDGKMVGALSYRIIRFEKEGWCGFTPIADMIETGETEKIGFGKIRLSQVDRSGAMPVSDAVSSNFQLLPSGLGDFQPLALPVTVGGLNPRAFGWLQSQLEKLGFDGRLMPLAGGGGGEDQQQLKTAFEPGVPVAAVLASGDIHMAGTGTLTWRRGNQVLGFGHPMMQAGKVAIPMARAEIVATISSYLTPHKISNTRQIVGTIQQDRLTAIAGEIGPVPPMTDLTIQIQTPQGERKLHSRIFQNRDLTPTIAASCLTEAVTGTVDYSDEFSLAVRGDVVVRNHGTIHLEDFYSGGNHSEHLGPVADLLGRLNELCDNRFEQPQLEKIDFHLKLEEKRRTLELGEVMVDRDKAKPGDTVTIRVLLKPWRGERRLETMSFTVPDGTRPGDLEILIGDARSADALDGRSRTSHAERPQNLDQIVNVLNQYRRHDALYLRVTRKADGMVVADQRMPSLPPSVMALYDSSRTILDAARLDRVDLVEKRLPLESVLHGSQTLKVRIE